MKKLLIVLLAIVTCFSFAACGSSNEKKESAADAGSAETNVYEGKQFAGESPWDGELAVTVRTLGDTMDWTFTMSAGDEVLYQEVTGTVMKDGIGEFSVEGKIEDETASEDVGHEFAYSGTIALKDGNVVVTFSSGAYISKSPNGDSNAMQVDALADADKECVLTPAN